MTRAEMIDNMASVLIDALDRETVDKFIEDDNGNLIGIETYSLYEVAKQLYNAGYRKILLDAENGRMIDCVTYTTRELVERKIENSCREAVREFAEELKALAHLNLNGTYYTSVVSIGQINELLEEYKR